MYFPVEAVGLAFFLAIPLLLTLTAIDVGELGIDRDSRQKESFLAARCERLQHLFLRQVRGAAKAQ